MNKGANRKRNRRSLNKNKRNQLNILGKSLSIVGINTAGLTSKLESFDKLLYDVKPSIFILQETKRRLGAPKIKARNICNYQVFELRRELAREEGGKGLSGGGLAVGALHELKPVLVRQGDDDVECLTIEVTTGTYKIRCVNGYGPQLGDSQKRKDMFWKYLDREVIEADLEGVGLVIEMDSNCWAGKNIIPKDPNNQNSNGKLLEMFLERNKGIHLVNSLQLCKGLITRKRTTNNRQEEAALDLPLVCSKILPLVMEMHVDEQGEHQLSNFSGIKHNRKVTESDHAKVELKLDAQFPQARPSRIETFNFKDNECKKLFKDCTNNTKRFTMCFSSNETFPEQIRKWEKNLKSCIFKCFPKICSRKRKFSESRVGKLLEERKQLKLELAKNPSIDNEFKKKKLDIEISVEKESQFMQKVQETLGHITGDDGGISTHGIWKAKNNLIPNDKGGNPVALKDKKGNMISSPEAIKKLCLEEMVERLRHRTINPDLVHLQKLKEQLCKKRIELVKHVKSAHWTVHDLEKVLKTLKNGKCRDPTGLVNELLKPNVAGEDLIKSLLFMLNKAKETLHIPEMMKQVNIAMLPKPGKPGIHNLENQRGIFLISVFRSIIMKLLLKDNYDILDNHMTDSNIGGRKNRRIQDHLFIVNGILYDVTRRQKKKPISICVYDCRQCFDSMWQEEVLNDIFEAGVKDDHLALLQEINMTNYVSVKTQHGLTDRTEINKVICQGDPWGPIQCTVQIDGIGRGSLEADLEPYKYKDEVEIPALGMVDDILTISESGYKTSRMNSYINAKIAMKKLQLGPKKCSFLHTGKGHENIELFVDGWEIKSVKDVETGKNSRQDIFEGSIEMSHLGSDKYLGQTISADGRNTNNIEKIKNKGIGIQNRIIQMLEIMPGGKFHFQIAIILRNSILLSSILSSSEVWYGITQQEYEQLEQVDEMLMRNLMKCSSSVPKDLLYLELSVLPIRFIIQTRRLLYLHHILQQKEDSLLYRFFMAQLTYPTYKD